MTASSKNTSGARPLKWRTAGRLSRTARWPLIRRQLFFPPTQIRISRPTDGSCSSCALVTLIASPRHGSLRWYANKCGKVAAGAQGPARAWRGGGETDMDAKTAAPIPVGLGSYPRDVRPHDWWKRVQIRSPRSGRRSSDVPVLLEKTSAGLQPKTIFAELQLRKPWPVPRGQLRRFRRKVAALGGGAVGAARKCSFPFSHSRPGRLAASDFTRMSDLQ